MKEFNIDDVTIPSKKIVDDFLGNERLENLRISMPKYVFDAVIQKYGNPRPESLRGDDDFKFVSRYFDEMGVELNEDDKVFIYSIKAPEHKKDIRF